MRLLTRVASAAIVAVLAASTATLSASASSNTSPALYAKMGRYHAGNNDAIVFDNNGFSLAVLFSGTTSVSMPLSVTHTAGPGPTVEAHQQSTVRTRPMGHNHNRDRETTNNEHPMLGCSFVAPNLTSIPWEPHMFVAFAFDLGEPNATTYEEITMKFTAMPPSLDHATMSMNFTTIAWPIDTTQTVDLFSGLNSNHTYAVYVVKATEPDWNLAVFGPNGVSSPWPNFIFSQPIPLLPAFATPKRRMEFVGDSLTAGYCNLCKDPNTYANQDYAATWSFLTAQAFNSHYHTIAWSGYGVVRNCGGGKYQMPQIYERTVATDGATVWDWQRYEPDVLVLDLGANDHLSDTDPGALENDFVRTYIDMVNRTVAERYKGRTTPSVGQAPMHVFLLCGPTHNDGYCPYIATIRIALEDIFEAATRSTGGYNVKFHFAHLIIPDADRCCGHPSVAGDRIAAQQLTALVANVTGWSVVSPP